MNVIDELIRQGRDPLEALLLPPAPDIAAMLEHDANEKLDKRIRAELNCWPADMRERLRKLCQEAATYYAAAPDAGDRYATGR